MNGTARHGIALLYGIRWQSGEGGIVLRVEHVEPWSSHRIWYMHLILDTSNQSIYDVIYLQ